MSVVGSDSVRQNSIIPWYYLNPLERQGWSTFCGSAISAVGIWFASTGVENQSPLLGVLGLGTLCTGVSMAYRGGGCGGAAAAITSSGIAFIAAKESIKLMLEEVVDFRKSISIYVNAANNLDLNSPKDLAVFLQEIGKTYVSVREMQIVIQHGMRFLSKTMIISNLLKTTQGIASAILGSISIKILEDKKYLKNAKAIALTSASITLGSFCLLQLCRS